MPISGTLTVSAHEQVSIFLFIAINNTSSRTAAEQFQHSTETISHYMNNVIEAILRPTFYGKYVQLPSIAVPSEIKDNPKYFPFFQNVLAAIDGSHINATPASGDRARYHNHKGLVSQNILFSCTFDMRFCHVLSGWEGSVHDGNVYDDARANDLKIPEGKCYLGDAGFPSCNSLLVPYRGVRYHLKEWGKANTR
jgi:hypothetical protein